MSEDKVDQTPAGINEEVQLLKKGQLISREEALPIIGEQLQTGQIVLLGDSHGRREQHDYFASVIDTVAQQGVAFSVALELPTQLEESANTESAEQLGARLNFITGFKDNRRIGPTENILSADLPPIIQACRKYDIPVVCIDDCKVDLLPSERNHFNNIAGVKTRNDWMARRLKEGQAKYGREAILTMVGAIHLEPKAIPQRLTCITFRMGADRDYRKLGLKSPTDDKDFDYVIDLDSPKSVDA